MSIPRRSIEVSIFATLLLCSSLLSACVAAPLPESDATDPSDVDTRDGYLAAIRVGTEDRLIEVPVDGEVTSWLNTTDDSAGSLPPTPDIDDWRPFVPPSDVTSIVFEPGGSTPFDVLEILAYPEGLDDQGVPVSVVVHPLCGPQADHSCTDVAWGENGVEIPGEAVDAAIADTQYYAIAGVLLPDGDAHPDSFMALLTKKAP